MSELAGTTMVFRGFCSHGKVRVLMCEPKLTEGRERIKDFKKNLANMKRRMHTTDFSIFVALFGAGIGLLATIHFHF